MKMNIFWVIAPRSLVALIALMMEAASTSEKSVNFYHTTHGATTQKTIILSNYYLRMTLMHGPIAHPSDSTWMSMEQRWNNINRGKQSTTRKTCFISTFSSRNLTALTSTSKLVRRGEKPAKL
jgi:hypothetical protein